MNGPNSGSGGVVIRAASRGEPETIDIGERLGAIVRPGDIVLLDGPLGAGKTRLVRGMARAMGVDESLVASPTYVIAHEYPPVRALGTPLVHMDAYRLSGPDDLDGLGWDRLADGSKVVVIEWGERVAAGLAAEPVVARVRIDPDGEGAGGRSVTLLAPPAWTGRKEWGLLRVLDVSEPQRVRCPVCGRTVQAPGGEAAAGGMGGWGVFCSDRCRGADLGRWLTEAYRVGRPIGPDDFGET